MECDEDPTECKCLLSSVNLLVFTLPNSIDKYTSKYRIPISMDMHWATASDIEDGSNLPVPINDPLICRVSGDAGCTVQHQEYGAIRICCVASFS